MPKPPLPRLAPDAAFVPFHEVDGRPHIVVDGPALPGTAVGLSHWPDGGVPDELAADTSAAIVARYLDAKPDGPEVGLVTNNHFDEDGLLAAWMLLERTPPGARRELAIAAAEAGDFSTWTRPEAAWCALTLMAMAERGTTPFPGVLRALNRAGPDDPAGAITNALLPHVSGVLDDPGRFRLLWEPAWRVVERDAGALDAGSATIEETGGDLAIVRSPRPLARLALFPRVGAMRVIHAAGGEMLWLEHRYETWVRYASRPLPPRVDLAPALPVLQALEPRSGTWRFEGVDRPQARLVFVDAVGAPAPSGLHPEALAEAILQIIEETSATR